MQNKKYLKTLVLDIHIYGNASFYSKKESVQEIGSQFQIYSKYLANTHHDASCILLIIFEEFAIKDLYGG